MRGATVTVTASLCAQETKPKPEETEIWEPVPKVVTPERHERRAAFGRDCVV